MLENLSEFTEVFKAAARIGSQLITLGQAATSKGAEESYANSLNETISEMNETILSAQSTAIAAQAAQMSQLQKIHALEQEIADLHDWDVEKTRYGLVQVSENVAAFAYLLKKDAAQVGEPLHYICTQCYQDRVKSIIQYNRTTRRHICPKCQTVYTIQYAVASSHGIH